MTALGLVVAIPAVLACNFVVRANRRIVAELDTFAHDLHALIVERDGLGQTTQPTGAL
jgi:biopolymer transport protein ExbB